MVGVQPAAHANDAGGGHSSSKNDQRTFCEGIGPGCWNTINLHTHGLHVSPAGNSDNVLLNIAPQTEFTFEINVPDDHPSGTFWYHAHRHGSTALQVASGASGILIVRGDRPYDPARPQAPADVATILRDKEGKPFAEQLFLLQQISYGCFNNDPSVAGGPWQQKRPALE